MATTKKTTDTPKIEEAAEAVGADVIALDTFMLNQNQRTEEIEHKLSSLQASLNEPFPSDVERELKKGGAYLTYIPVSEVINRLNKVLGFYTWSYEIVRCERDAHDPDFIVAHVRMTVNCDGVWNPIVRDGFGGQKIKRTKQGDIVDLGDEFKGAVSDALKKAAQSLGVGLYLARTEEAMEYDNSSQQQIPAREENPALDKLWNSFVSVSKSLDSDAKALLNDFWVEYSGGRPKPTRDTAEIKDIEELLAEATKLYLDAENLNG